VLTLPLGRDTSPKAEGLSADIIALDLVQGVREAKDLGCVDTSWPASAGEQTVDSGELFGLQSDTLADSQPRP
jgi:hypothetical protein